MLVIAVEPYGEFRQALPKLATFLLSGAPMPGSAMKTSLSLLPPTCAGNSCSSSSGTLVSVAFPVGQSKCLGDTQEF